MGNDVLIGLTVAGTVAFVVSFSVCLLVRQTAPKVGLLDRPSERKIHSSPVPLGGGIGIWCGVLVPIFLLYGAAYLVVRGISLPVGETFLLHAAGIMSSGGRLAALLGLASLLFLLGTLDDRYGLSWKLRLSIEFLVAAAAVALGWEATFFLNIPILTKLVSLLWIVGLTNSFNLIDNMDGLSSGVAAICAAFLAAILFFCSPNRESGDPQIFLGGFLIILIGAIMGFWFHNMPKARLFMGDGGAYFIGFLLATVTLSSTFTGSGTPSRTVLAPLCIFAVPLYDTISVICIRLAHGKSPFTGDTNHYSHRLVAIGLSKTGSVLTIYLTTAICGIGAIFLYQVNSITAVLVGVQVGMVLLLNGILEFTARRKIFERQNKDDRSR
jgi:UDP-GlcNAc:undecaprenyl-phosphate GlcNAc-1-phosphate transferase